MTRTTRGCRALTGTALALLAACSGPQTQPDTDDDYAARMATEHATDAPTPAAAGDAELGIVPDVETERVVYGDMDGKPITGVLAIPPSGASGAPAIIVIHEWWGLNDNVIAMAKRLAGQGYLALAVDLYGGASATTPDEAKALMMASMKIPELLTSNLRQAHAHLKSRGAAKVGTLGWCFGGGWSLGASLALGDEVDATVIYYGKLETDRGALEKLASPVLGVFGAEDKGIPQDSVKAFRATLEELGKPAEIHIYEGADHAFANPSGQRYNADAARDAWSKTLAFLALHL